MVKAFVYAHWLERNPVGAVAISFQATCMDDYAADLHNVLERRSGEFRPYKSADSLERIECLLKSLLRVSL